MKTTNQRSNSNSGFGRFGKSARSSAASSSTKKDEELIVIRDASTSKEYYLSVVDTFVLSKKEYVVMYNYVPDDGSHKSPELVIMRTGYGKNGDQYFYSIKDKNELEIAFSYFMRRYFASSAPQKQNRSGVSRNYNAGRE